MEASDDIFEVNARIALLVPSTPWITGYTKQDKIVILYSGATAVRRMTIREFDNLFEVN